jgi:hypothetical protein
LKVLDYVDERNKIYVITKDSKLWGIPVEQTNQPTSSHATKSGPNHEIFAELLGDHGLDSSADQTCRTTPFGNVHQCCDDQVIHWESGLRDVAIGLHHIITYSNSESEIRLTIYPWNNDAGKQEIAPNFLYQTLLTRDICHHSNSDVATISYVSANEQCGIRLDPVFFNSLFHGQCGPNCPVALVALQSGMVAYIQVGVKNRSPGNPNLETLYHLEQPVLSIFPVCSKPPSPKGAHLSTTPTGDTLCVLGTLGKLVLITQDISKGQPDSIVIREYHVPGPVACAAIGSNLSTLFYSTLKEVYAVQLGGTKTGGNGETPLPSSLSPTILNIPKVSALSTDETSSLICLKTDGRVLLVSEPLAEETPRSSSQDGDQIKKHLEEIHEKASEVKNLRDEIRQLDEVIKKLNGVTQVLCEILRNRESQNFVESGISFKVGIDYEEQGTSLNPHVVLRCDLVNSTNFPFSSGWSLVVQIRTSQAWCNEECSVQATTNHSVPLSSASSHHVSIAMEDTFSYLNPLQVSCYVCFGLRELLPVFLGDSCPTLSEEGFSVLVSKVELNILNFLRKPETNPSVTCQHRQSRHPTHLLQSILKSVRESPGVVSQSSEETSVKFSTFSIRLTKEAVRFIESRVQEMNENGNEMDTKPNPKNSKASQQLSVLRFLLHGSRRHLHHDDVECSSGHMVARTPNEEVVKFQVANQEGTTQDIEGLEVRVHTSSQALACSVHSSLLKVLKVGVVTPCVVTLK